MDKVSKRFLRWLERQRKKGNTIPAALELAEAAIKSGNMFAEKLDDLSLPPSPGVQPLSDRAWNDALQQIYTGIAEVGVVGHYHKGLRSLAFPFEQMQQVIDLLLERSVPYTPLNAFMAEAEKLRDGIYLTNDDFELAMSRVRRPDTGGAM